MVVGLAGFSMEDVEEEAPAPEQRSRAGAIAVAAWGLVIFAGTRAIELVLESQSMATAVGQAVLAEWGGSRLDVTWSDPATPSDSVPAAIARRIAIGMAYGFAAAGVLYVILRATGAIVVHAVHDVWISLLLVGLATAALHAMRDEILLHGIALRALRDVDNGVVKALACGITSAGAALGEPNANVRSIVAHALFGVALGALWVEDRGAWRPWAAHAAFLFATGPLLRGGVVDARIVTSTWTGAESGILGGIAAVVALAPFAVAALGRLARKHKAST